MPFSSILGLSKLDFSFKVQHNGHPLSEAPYFS